MASRSYENDVLASKNAPEVALCTGNGEPAHKIDRDRIPWKSMTSLGFDKGFGLGLSNLSYKRDGLYLHTAQLPERFRC